MQAGEVVGGGAGLEGAAPKDHGPGGADAAGDGEKLRLRLHGAGARHKAEVEAPYHELTRGGHIFYVEIDGDATHNPEVIMRVVDMMDQYNIGYGSVNHNRNRCLECGYENSTPNLEACPKCGSTHIDKLQRITGYLVGTTDRWNNAKLAELNDRVIHN